MYHDRKMNSFHPNSVVKDSVNVPTPYSAIPAAHHRRWGPDFRSFHRR